MATGICGHRDHELTVVVSPVQAPTAAELSWTDFIQWPEERARQDTSASFRCHDKDNIRHSSICVPGDLSLSLCVCVCVDSVLMSDARPISCFAGFFIQISDNPFSCLLDKGIQAPWLYPRALFKGWFEDRPTSFHLSLSLSVFFC